MFVGPPYRLPGGNKPYADTTCQPLLDKVLLSGYSRSMKIKTSITVSEELLKVIDEYAKKYNNRSEFIEEAVRVFLKQLIRKQQDDRDLEIINQRADYLNTEATDVLTYQVNL